MTYRYVFAVATEDSVYLYDTQNLTPFAFVTGIHYSNLSDLSWSNDGRILIITSIDGFCSFVTFNQKELGEVYTETAMETETSVSLTSNETECKQKEKIKVKVIEIDVEKSVTEEVQHDIKVLSDVIVLQNKSDGDKKSNSKRIKLIPI